MNGYTYSDKTDEGLKKLSATVAAAVHDFIHQNGGLVPTVYVNSNGGVSVGVIHEKQAACTNAPQLENTTLGHES